MNIIAPEAQGAKKKSPSKGGRFCAPGAASIKVVALQVLEAVQGRPEPYMHLHAFNYY